MFAQVEEGLGNTHPPRSGCLPSALCVYHVIFLRPANKCLSLIIPVYLHSPGGHKANPNLIAFFLGKGKQAIFSWFLCLCGI